MLLTPTRALASSGEVESTSYRPDIDGLRAIAILMVVGYHVGIPGFDGGFVGVDVFFVISGWLIVGHLVRELEMTGTVRLLPFFARRVRRLLPAAAVMLTIVLLLGLAFLDPLGQQQALAKVTLASLALASNIYFYKLEPTGYFDVGAAQSPLLHTWSLSVEEQFYFLAPIGLMAIGWVARRTGVDRRRLVLSSLVIVAGTSLAAACWAATIHPGAAFYLPFARGYEFLAGGLAALAWPRLGRFANMALGSAGVLVLAFITWRALPHEGWPGAYALVPVLAATVILTSTTASSSAVSRALSAKPLVWVGRRSYSWYLWHLPLLALADAWYLSTLPITGRVLVVAAALVAAHLSFEFVEQKARRRVLIGNARRQRRVILSAALASIVMAVAACALGSYARSSRDDPPWALLGQSRMQTSCPGMVDSSIVETTVACEVVPQVDGRASLIVWGDSHAWHLLDGLRRKAEADGLNLFAVVRGGCPPYDPDSMSMPSLPPTATAAIASCDVSNSLALSTTRSLAARGPVTVILAARWEPYLGEEPFSLADRGAPAIFDHLETGFRERLATGLAGALADVKEVGGTSELVLPTPEFKRDVPRCVLTPRRPFRCDVSRDQAEEYRRPAVEFIRSVAARGSSVAVVDLLPELCNEQRCEVTAAGEFLYMDDDHLSTFGSQRLMEAWAPVTRRLEDRLRFESPTGPRPGE